jgi:dihydrofolate reductase
MWNLVTLDGFFEGPTSWDLAFHKHAWGDELEQHSIEQLRSSDTLLFGRVTYQGMAAYWTTHEGVVADFMNSMRKVVFSTTLDKAEWNDFSQAKRGRGSCETEAAARQGHLHLRQRVALFRTYAASFD